MDIATPVDRHRIFDDPWCPLYGKIPDVLKGSGDKLTDQCVIVIEESRKIWTCDSVAKDKLKIAKELWDLFRIHHNLVSNGHTRIKSITTESICETIIAETKKLSLSGLDGITHAEILAIYTIHVVFSTLKDLWEPLDKMEIDNILYYLYSPLDEDSFIKAKIYIARLLLSQAKKMANYTQEETKKEKITQPEYKSEKQTENNVFRWCGGTWEITYNGKTINPPDSKGLRYIHYLMHHPGKQIHVLGLLQIGTSSEKAKQSLIEKGKNTEVKGLNEFSFEEDNSMDKLSIQTYKEDDVTDDLSIEEYERCLSHLKEQKEATKLAGKIEDIKELQEKIEHIEKLLKTSKNKKGLLRKFVGDEQKIRKAVFDCVKRTLEMLEKEHHSFWKHLKPPTITTGLYCKYSPTEEISWIL